LTSESDIIVERKGAVCTLTINRPEKRNALTPECLARMADVLDSLADDGSVRAVVLRGAGERVFSAGYDITALPTDSGVAERLDPGAESPLERTIQAMRRFPYPVIAMLNGDAFGGACELAICCDIRIQAKHARMGMPPAKLGLVYPYAGYRRFLALLGLSRALEIFLTGRTYDSAQCLGLGLVNYVVPAEQLSPFTYDMAEEIADNAPLSLRGSKAALYKIAETPVLTSSEEVELQSLFVRSLQSEDVKEGKRAFREKRKPRFQGR